jgi:ATP-binding protein involved in chromosome partitioning
MFQELKIPIFGIVENMSYYETPDGENLDIFGQGGGKILAQATGVPFIGNIPIDPAVRKGGDTGKPVVVSNPDSPASEALCKVAETIAAQVSIHAYQGQED